MEFKKVLWLDSVCWMNPWTCLEKMTFTKNDRYLDVYLYFIKTSGTRLLDTKVIVRIDKVDKNGDKGETILK